MRGLCSMRWTRCIAEFCLLLAMHSVEIEPRDSFADSEHSARKTLGTAGAGLRLHPCSVATPSYFFL